MSQDLITKVRQILATNIEFLRKSKGLKREELSLLLGFDNSYISKLEKCKINITLDKLIKIADFFDVDVKDLFFNT